MARYSRNDQAGVELPKARLDGESLREALRLFGCLRPHRWRFAAGVGALMASSLLSLAFPHLAGSLVDAAARGGAGGGAAGWGGVDRVAGLLMGVLAVQACFSFFHALTFASVAQRGLSELRVEVFGRVLALPMSFLTRTRAGELASRLSADMTQIEDTLTGVLPQMLRQGTLLLGGIGLIAATSWRLTGVMLATLPVLVAVAVVFGRRTRRFSREAQDRLAETATVVDEALQGIASVKAFANEEHERARYRAGMGRFVEAGLRGARVRAGFIAFIVFALFGGVVVVLWSGARLMQSGEITFGELMRFILYTTFVAGAMGQVAELYSQLQKTVGATQRVRELLREPMEEGEGMGAVGVEGLAPLGGGVRLEGVRFAYPSRPGQDVLRGVTMEARPGQRVALVGPSGAGKSTLVSLVLRLYEPGSGRVLMDGRDASGLPLRWMRSQIALVPQEVLLFGGTIAENIAYGRPGASREEVEEAARKAHADGFIRGFPEGYETTVGDRGMRLSGGQRQRIAIARAILRNPAVLLLDEATSALDSESEAAVQAALDNLLKGRTSLIVAHRLSTVRDADWIVVLDEGRVVEEGTHEALMGVEGGLYRRLAGRQFGAG